MSSSLSSLVSNFSNGLYSDKCTDCKSCLDYMSVKNDQHSCTQLIFKCFKHQKDYNKDFNKDLIKRFENAYEFCDRDINKFVLLLRKGVYSHEYMDSWERFNEELLPNKEGFYSSVNMGDITDVYYIHAKRVFKHFYNENLGDYHDLYVQSDTLLLSDLFGNFRNKCIEVYGLDSAHFLSAPGLA